MAHIRRNFRQRLQHKAPQVHPRMRDLQFGRVDCFLAVQQNVEINQSRAFRDELLAAHVSFDLPQRLQQCSRRQLRLCFNGAVKEPRLIQIIDGFGLVH